MTTKKADPPSSIVDSSKILVKCEKSEGNVKFEVELLTTTPPLPPPSSPQQKEEGIHTSVKRPHANA